VHEFLGVVRNRIKLPPEQALFLFVNNSIASSSDLMSSLYDREKDDDGFLYITYSGKPCQDVV
jgi:GABA(A) receptor-associated protein